MGQSKSCRSAGAVRIAGSPPFQLLLHLSRFGLNGTFLQHPAARPRDLVQSFPCCCHIPPSLSLSQISSFLLQSQIADAHPSFRAFGNPWLRRKSILGAGVCTSVIRRHSDTTLEGSRSLLQFSDYDAEMCQHLAKKKILGPSPQGRRRKWRR